MTRPPADRSVSVFLSFRAQNVRSFRDEVEFSLLAAARTESSVARPVPWREGGKPVNVLPAAGIFGANASGKTNLLRALADMREHVLLSFRTGSPTGGIRRRPFLLDPASRKAPSRFEIDLVLHGVRHEYGFVIDDERVVEEWAHHYPHGRTALLFHRRGDEVELGTVDRGRGRTVLALLRPNALFLSTAASANHPTLLPLYAWFERNLLLADTTSRPLRQVHTLQLLAEPDSRDLVLALLHAADLGLSGATEHQHEFPPEVQERLRQAIQILTGKEGEFEGSIADVLHSELRLTHQGTDGDVELEVGDESLGTLVWFGLVGPVVHALAHGCVLLVDELDASLHPALVSQLVWLFQQPDTNPRRSQLVFNSHDTTLLGDSSGGTIGRDQVWFTEKGHGGGTRLYPLTDLDPRKEEAIGKRYLAGRYGATPILSQQQFAAAAELITTCGRSS